MSKKLWFTSDDESIQYVSINQELLPGVLDIMRNSFFKTENLSIGVGLPLYPEAVLELDEVVLEIVKAGISIAAVERSTNYVVGVALNKTQARTENNFYLKFVDTVKHPSARGFLEVLSEAESHCDFFEHCNVDCVGEIMLLGVRESHRKKGIAKKLCEVSIDILSRLSKGENVNQPISDTHVIDSKKPVPKIATAIFTSFVTQKIAKQLGFVIVTRVSTEKLIFNGTSINSATGNNTPEYTLEYKQL